MDDGRGWIVAVTTIVLATAVAVSMSVAPLPVTAIAAGSAVIWMASSFPVVGLGAILSACYASGAAHPDWQAALLVTLIAALLLAALRNRLTIPFRPLLAVVALAFWATLSVITASPSVLRLPGTGVGPLVLFCALLLLAPYARTVHLTPQNVLQLTAMLGGVFIAFGLSAATFEGTRATALGLNPNGFGHAAAVTLLAAAPFWRRPWAWATIAVCGYALVLTASRGAILVVLAGIAIHALAGKRRSTRVAIVGIVLALVVAVPGPLTRAEDLSGTDRPIEDASESRDTRFAIARLAISAMADHPIDGLGFRRFPEYAYFSGNFGRPINTHNEYLRIGAETGVVGLLLFLGVLLPAIRHTPSDREERYLKGMLTGAMVSMALANGLTIIFIAAPLWLAVGVLSVPSSERDGATLAPRVSHPIPDTQRPR